MDEARKPPDDKIIIGCVEICDLPDLFITDLEVRIDTGAKTSSLHVDNLSPFKKAGKPWVKFDIHPHIHNVDDIVQCKAPVKDIRTIKSSNGISEKRYVINTAFKIGGFSWLIDITLTNRSDMTYLMLLGREGMGNLVLVDPSRTFVMSKA
ncbi:ATP-dependent zinc protease family protein [Endozoicomonadaceae bacterium StTr2]